MHSVSIGVRDTDVGGASGNAGAHAIPVELNVDGVKTLTQLARRHREFGHQTAQLGPGSLDRLFDLLDPVLRRTDASSGDLLDEKVVLAQHLSTFLHESHLRLGVFLERRPEVFLRQDEQVRVADAADVGRPTVAVFVSC